MVEVEGLGEIELKFGADPVKHPGAVGGLVEVDDKVGGVKQIGDLLAAFDGNAPRGVDEREDVGEGCHGS